MRHPFDGDGTGPACTRPGCGLPPTASVHGGQATKRVVLVLGVPAGTDDEALVAHLAHLLAPSPEVVLTNLEVIP